MISEVLISGVQSFAPRLALAFVLSMLVLTLTPTPRLTLVLALITRFAIQPGPKPMAEYGWKSIILKGDPLFDFCSPGMIQNLADEAGRLAPASGGRDGGWW